MTKEELLKKFGEHIVSLREKQGLSQSDLARLSGKDRQNIYRLEQGEINPTLFQLTELADALKIPIAQLVTIEPSTY